MALTEKLIPGWRRFFAKFWSAWPSSSRGMDHLSVGLFQAGLTSVLQQPRVHPPLYAAYGYLVSAKGDICSNPEGWSLESRRTSSGCYITWPISEFYIFFNSLLNSLLKWRWNSEVLNWLSYLEKLALTKVSQWYISLMFSPPPLPFKKGNNKPRKAKTNFQHTTSAVKMFKSFSEKFSVLWLKIMWEKFRNRHSNTRKNTFFLLCPVFFSKKSSGFLCHAIFKRKIKEFKHFSFT